jgi:hypothetical protein
MLLRGCPGGQSTPAPTVLTAEVGNLSGTFQKPTGCNDPCQSIAAVFSTTDEALLALNPDWHINWGDNSPEEQLMQGTHTYPLGAPRTYDVTLRGDVKNGDATMSVLLKVAVRVPFEVPVTTAPTEANTDPPKDP